jgi:hypothetical protein
MCSSVKWSEIFGNALPPQTRGQSRHSAFREAQNTICGLKAQNALVFFLLFHGHSSHGSHKPRYSLHLRQILVMSTWLWFCGHAECKSYGFCQDFKQKSGSLGRSLLQGWSPWSNCPLDQKEFDNPQSTKTQTSKLCPKAPLLASQHHQEWSVLANLFHRNKMEKILHSLPWRILMTPMWHPRKRIIKLLDNFLYLSEASFQTCSFGSTRIWTQDPAVTKKCYTWAMPLVPKSCFFLCIHL